MPFQWTSNTPLNAENLNQMIVLDNTTNPPKIYINGVDSTNNIVNALYNQIVGNAINASY